jgi:hypothetical protein
LDDFGRFWTILVDFGRFWAILGDFGRFWAMFLILGDFFHKLIRSPWLWVPIIRLSKSSERGFGQIGNPSLFPVSQVAHPSPMRPENPFGRVRVGGAPIFMNINEICCFG